MIRLLQNSFTTGVLDEAASARSDLQKFRSGVAQLDNFIVLLHGGILNRPGTKYVDNPGAPGRLIPFQYSSVQTYVLGLTDKKMRIYKNGGTVIYPVGHAKAGEVVEVTTPYALADLPRLKYTQSADTLFMTHPSYVPYKLTRSSHYDWSFIALDFTPTAVAPSDLAASKSGFSGTVQDISYKVSTVLKNGEESEPSGSVTVQIANYWPSGGRITLTWGAVAGAVEYNVYKNSRGYYGWVATISAEDARQYKDDNVEPDTSIGPQKFKNPFEEGANPGCVGLYQQRLVLARTNDEPQTVWTSQIGALNNFGVSSPLQATDAIDATIASQKVNEVRHLVPLKNLLVFTSGGEWMMSAGRNADALSPTALCFDVQSCWGCAEVPPLIIGDNVLFVREFGHCVRDLEYTLQADGYRGSDLSVLAKSLFESPIVNWTYQQEPWSLVWCVRADGVLLSLAYMKEQQVWAWSTHNSDGAFLDVCSIKGENRDDVYFIVRRAVNGETVYYVEYLADRLPVGSSDATEAFFVDCGATYRGTATKTVSGLGHLEGKTVIALADGSPVVSGLTVVNGAIDLPYSASTVHVGLPFKSVITTLDQELAPQGDTSVGRTKRVIGAVCRVKKSRGFTIGTDETAQSEPKFEPAEKYGMPPPLYSGDMRVDFEGDYRDECTVTLCQSLPLPVTLLSLTLEVEIGS